MKTKLFKVCESGLKFMVGYYSNGAFRVGFFVWNSLFASKILQMKARLGNFNFNFSEFQQLGNKCAKYILYCAFLVTTQWFSIFNNFKQISIKKFSFFGARPFANYFVPQLFIYFIYLFIQSFLKVGLCISFATLLF